MADSTHNTLYLEADEDITSAIAKLNHLSGARVSIVVPKHSTLLQSIINLRLLKKAAADAGKAMVLVTTDRTATSLAGRVGLAVASSLTARPVVSHSKPEPDSGAEIDETDPVDTAPPEVAAMASGVGQSGSGEPKSGEAEKVDPPPADPAQFSKRPVGEGKTPEPDQSAKLPTPAAAMATVVKGLHVPDFSSLQKRLFWGGLAIGVIIIFLVVQFIISSATVTLFAQGSKVDTSFGMHVDPAAKTSDPSKSVVVGQTLSSSKVLTATAPATGTKDLGTKATGNITVTNYCYNPGTLPAGTVFIATSGQKFASNNDVAVPVAVPFQGNCAPTTVSVPVTASQNGDGYNLASGTLYTVGSAPPDRLKGTGGQMSGGTSKVAMVLTQADVDKARDAALAADKAGAQKDLESKVGSGYQVLGDSYNQAAAAVTANPAVDAQTGQSTVSITVNYTELAANTSDLMALLDQQEKLKIGPANQLYEDGFADAKFNGKPGAADFTVTAPAYSGAKLDTAKIAQQMAGQRFGDAADLATKLPGVQKVDINLWPGWVSRLPRITGHIHITIKVANSG